jgi:Cu-Zn family superoxide dismutase
MRAPAAALALILAAGCGGGEPAKQYTPAQKPAMGVAKLTSKNGSTVRGFISFTQEGDKVAVAGDFFELYSGSHSLYIHEVGNCSSPNAASAGRVWNVPGNASAKRTGELVQLRVGSEGHAEFSYTLSDVSVGTGKPNDVIGHSVVVHATVDPDPKPEFGVRNGWLACGVIQRGEGFDLKKIL